jgi:hypothetical protein
LSNKKNCVWLYNDKEGYSVRKDKNCGGRFVVDDTGNNIVVYDTTELGTNCPQTCRAYNGCDAVAKMSGTIANNNDSSANNECKDKDGLYKNHRNIDKTCTWLYNEKPGKTDRKDKNCGTNDYPISDLGKACLHTCFEYNTHMKINVDCV